MTTITLWLPLVITIAFFWWSISPPLNVNFNGTFFVFFTGAGWFLAAIALLQLPIWAAHVIYKQKSGTTLMQVARH